MDVLTTLAPFQIATDPYMLALQIAFLVVPMLLFMVFGQRLSLMQYQGDVSRGLSRLSMLRDKSKQTLMSYVTKRAPGNSDVTKKMDDFLEYFTIQPVSMDPNGIVKKMDHILTTQDDRIREEVSQILPNLNEVERSVVENMAGVAAAMNQIYKIIRHFYLLGKKSSNFYLITQLYMILPTLLKQADAVVTSMGTLEQGQPLGDGIGPMSVGLMMKDIPKTKIERDTVFAESTYKNRKMVLLKAEGPKGALGELDDALIKMLGGDQADTKAIIMVDGALKLEGEKTGDVAEGVGAAIGGYGVEKFKIEDAAYQKNIPLYAVIVKESIVEAIGAMRQEVSESVGEVHKAIYRIIEQTVPENGKVVVIGVGNTLGIAQ
ncbi:MAG TPA: DUF1512 domain-containing protein [Conexivisphaerales archaeon]|nr:DUF1512 domain-containing protein [Conexivisphaerales archaeon]